MKPSNLGLAFKRCKEENNSKEKESSWNREEEVIEKLKRKK